MALARQGHVVLTATDGVEALATAIERRPDVVLSDVMMPRRTGLELLQDLAADERLAHIPVVLTSAHSDPEILAAPAFRFVPKPFTIADLTQAVAEAVEQASA